MLIPFSPIVTNSPAAHLLTLFANTSLLSNKKCMAKRKEYGLFMFLRHVFGENTTYRCVDFTSNLLYHLRITLLK